MTLFDEVQQLSSESHAKWFERYFEKYNLEQKLKTSAQKGYTGYLINVWSVRDEYLRNRLGDERTMEDEEIIGNIYENPELLEVNE
ncbi:YopX family protein [Streptococcus pneumoniae]|nr:YopX family protein [Streptococcus pneumoniae]MDS3028299.1 YopX family protein [Streptococcus pneumoniae]MDS3323865.1 YopX family protein [Streptococcus pneumoniae]MDS3349316.1 YopX family protein [Streptococcus pneumoniae]MDS3442546.1 YopX family protein [Streptococcus pneumoniae]